MRTKRKLSKFAVVGTAVTSAVFVLAIGSTSFASSSKTSPNSATLTKAPAIKMGGTAMWALPPWNGGDFCRVRARYRFHKFRELLQDQPEFGDTHEGARHQDGWDGNVGVASLERR